MKFQCLLHWEMLLLLTTAASSNTGLPEVFAESAAKAADAPGSLTGIRAMQCSQNKREGIFNHLHCILLEDPRQQHCLLLQQVIVKTEFLHLLIISFLWAQKWVPELLCSSFLETIAYYWAKFISLNLLSEVSYFSGGKPQALWWGLWTLSQVGVNPTVGKQIRFKVTLLSLWISFLQSRE